MTADKPRGVVPVMGAADAIGAHIYLQLHEQARGARTNKIDVRPWIEHW